MKRIFYIFYSILISTSLFSQKTIIDWERSQLVDFGSQKLNLPHFKNNVFSYDQNNIFHHQKQNVGDRNIKITNNVWKNISLQELYDLDPQSLAEDEINSISYNNTDKGRIANIAVRLFKKKNNQFYRLESFEIITDQQNINQSNTTKIGTSINPLSSGNFYKIKVDKSGIFKITKEFLQNNGINPANINPKNFRIYGNGGLMLPEYNQDTRFDALQENAIQVVGEQDGVWNDGDYALFYAQGPTGYNLYNTANGAGYKRNDTRTDRSEHLKNIYDDYAYYFINFDKGPGKRVETVDETLPNSLITRYDDYQYINNDKINLLKLGRTWVDEPYFNSNKSISFTLPNQILAGEPVKYRAQAVSYISQGNSITFTINNTNSQLNTVPATQEVYLLRYAGTINTITGNTITINCTPNITTNPNGVFYFDYAEIQYKQALAYNGSQMNFRDFSIESGSTQKYGFSVANANSIEQIWEVSDHTNATKRVNKASGNSTFNFAYTANNLHFNNEFVAFRADAAYTPTYVGTVENQNLQSLQNIDYLIITSPEMMSQAQRIAQHHETKNNFNVEIVDHNKIYNEYSSGGKDLTAIRDFITHLNTPAGNLKYVLLIGDTSYDYKNLTAGNDNIVPAYQSEESSNYINSFVMDDYVVMTAPQTTTYIPSIIPNIPIGRLPASNPVQAKELIDKTLAYENNLTNQSNPFGEWRLKMDYVVDDDCEGGPFHNLINDVIVQNFENATDKPEYYLKKLYLDSFPAVNTAGGQRFPQVNEAINKAFGSSLFLLYFGHGGINGWAQERLITASDVQNLNNFNTIFSRFPMVSTITCEFTLWDEPGTASVGEQLMKLKNGGPSTMITSSRAVQVQYGRDFSFDLIENLFKLYNDDFETVGNAYLKAKQEYGSIVDHFKVNYLGDPAMKLSRPKKRLIIDQITTPVNGTLSALDFVKITGHINKADGTLDNSFNGRVGIQVFDKRMNKQTLNNDGVGCLNPKLQYTEEGSPIVKASGVATNGNFTVEFYVPNDINYVLGTGRILAYADNKVYDVFNNTPYQIGGINPNGINDEEPPKVRLYMNNTNFADGGITNQNPTLLACVTDNTGINSTGAGIGHDIVAYLDGKIVNTILLNDYYNSGDGYGCSNPGLADYQKGYVTYPFRNLEPGEHTLTFKIWDINNNSTTETLRFVVKDETNQNITINRLLNWPNPFTDKTYIQFEHNCNDVLDVNVQIYTITGKLVRTFSQTITAEPYLQGFRTPRQAIEWDGKDDFGDAVGKGTYIFKIFARSQNQDKCKGGATATEKMVILK